MLYRLLAAFNCLFAYIFAYVIIIIHNCQNKISGMADWNDKVKRLLKSELIKRGVSNSELAYLLGEIGVHETKASIDSKISRGSFSASFFVQCLAVIGCNKIEIEEYQSSVLIAAEPNVEYRKESRDEK